MHTLPVPSTSRKCSLKDISSDKHLESRVSNCESNSSLDSIYGDSSSSSDDHNVSSFVSSFFHQKKTWLLSLLETRSTGIVPHRNLKIMTFQLLPLPFLSSKVLRRPRQHLTLSRLLSHIKKNHMSLLNLSIPIVIQKIHFHLCQFLKFVSQAMGSNNCATFFGAPFVRTKVWCGLSFIHLSLVTMRQKARWRVWHRSIGDLVLLWRVANNFTVTTCSIETTLIRLVQVVSGDISIYEECCYCDFPVFSYALHSHFLLE